jgi:hypothetical protein
MLAEHLTFCYLLSNGSFEACGHFKGLNSKCFSDPTDMEIARQRGSTDDTLPAHHVSWGHSNLTNNR